MNKLRRFFGVAGVSVLVSAASVAVTGSVASAIAGCSHAGSAGGTYTGSVCTSIKSPEAQRAKQICNIVGYQFYQYGGWKSTSNTWSFTPACSGTVNWRGQDIVLA